MDGLAVGVDEFRFGDLGLASHGRTLVDDLDRHLIADLRQPDDVPNVGAVLHATAVDGQHHVTWLKVGILCRRTGLHPGDDGALGLVDLEGLGQLVGEILNRHAEQAALDLAMLDQRVHDAHGHVDRDGEANADVAAVGRQDRGVDAHQLAAQVHQRAAGVAGVDGGVGLDEILVALDAQPGAAQRADDAGCHGLTETEGIADGDDEVTHLHPVGIGDRYFGEPVGLDLDHGNVRFAVGADQLGAELAAVGQGDGDLVGLVHHVIVGQHVAATGIDNHARTQTRTLALARHVRHAKEMPKHRVPHQRMLGLLDLRLGGDIDHARRDSLEHGRQAGHRLAIHRQRQGGPGWRADR